MSPAEIEKLKALEREATPGPWKQSDAQANVIEQDLGFSHMIALFSTYDAQEGRVYPGEDAACVAAMRNALPRLLEERERLLEALRAARGCVLIRSRVDEQDDNLGNNVLDTPGVARHDALRSGR